MMVWNIPVDLTEYLKKPLLNIDFLQPSDCHVSNGETSFDLKTKLLIKLKDFSWGCIMALLNIPSVMKDIR
jgi:hypothetical protein